VPVKPPPALITANAAAKLLSVTVDTIYRMSRAGRLPSVRIGCGDKRPRRRYRREDIERLTGRAVAS
jgi:excisionase family DNA binding protein